VAPGSRSKEVVAALQRSMAHGWPGNKMRQPEDAHRPHRRRSGSPRL